MHTPVAVTEEATKLVQQLQADCLIAMGGGSTIGLSKAIALRTDLPQIVVPTTYAGSEMTPLLGETHEGVKKTVRTPKVLPEVVIYDVDLTLSLPVRLSGVSGMNAIAHAIEALYAPDGNPVVDMLACEGIRSLAGALPRIAETPDDRSARTDALYGAWLGGTCLGAVSMALHHKLCHTLGGLFDLPHAETHTVVLPYVVRYNMPAAPEGIAKAAAALGVDHPAIGLYDLSGRMGAPRALAVLGMPRAGIVSAVEAALANPYLNPRPVDRQSLIDLIGKAWSGERP